MLRRNNKYPFFRSSCKNNVKKIDECDLRKNAPLKALKIYCLLVNFSVFSASPGLGFVRGHAITEEDLIIVGSILSEYHPRVQFTRRPRARDTILRLSIIDLSVLWIQYCRFRGNFYRSVETPTKIKLHGCGEGSSEISCRLPVLSYVHWKNDVDLRFFTWRPKRTCRRRQISSPHVGKGRTKGMNVYTRIHIQQYQKNRVRLTKSATVRLFAIRLFNFY